MSEPTGMGCDGLAEVAAELALGVLTGRERARALAHLDGCGACQERVRKLTVTGEGLLDLLPGSEPPAGFETRVIGRLGIGQPRRRRTRTQRIPPTRWIPRTRGMLAAAAVAVIAVAGGLGGWGLRGAASPPAHATSSTAQSSLRSATLVTASHQVAGTVFFYDRSPRWLYMSVDIGSRNGTITCQLEGRDGRIITVGSFRLNGGYGYWGSPVPPAGTTVTGARLTAADGEVLATASFSSPR